MLVYALSPTIGASPAVSIALALRLANSAGDIVAFALGWVLWRMKRERGAARVRPPGVMATK